ncbi:MAG TPA: phosphoribosylformylglycinamidine synthase I [Oligoflexia bacterium]|nr:phosphoribosylformylglycinamidine synthase I [Oligoflexia bacterium]
MTKTVKDSRLPGMEILQAKKAQVGVLVFPGTNCDQETHHVFENLMGLKTKYHWHDESLAADDYNLLVLPGGFSYGDYLRSGAMAKFSPALENIKDFIAAGGHVLGICNGFQILLELGLLPGALTRNKEAKFISDKVYLKVEHNDNPFLNQYQQEQVVQLPIAHADGRYYADEETLKILEDKGQVVLRYCDQDGQLNEASNVNGSKHAIAGLISENKQVMGLMPHPERCCEAVLGCDQGKAFFDSIHSLWNNS